MLPADLSLDELMPDDAELGLLLQSSAADPESTLLSGEQESLVHKAVLSILPRYRIIFVLHDMEDLDTAQIAQVLRSSRAPSGFAFTAPGFVCAKKCMRFVSSFRIPPPFPRQVTPLAGEGRCTPNALAAAANFSPISLNISMAKSLGKL